MDTKGVLRWVVRVNGVVIIGLSFYFLVLPMLMCLHFLHDDRLAAGKVPRAAYWLYGRLAPRYGEWARERVASGRAAELSKKQLVATEWPMFGTVFFLWGVEDLQAAWEADGGGGMAPNAYGRETLEACAALIADPGHAAWVKEHWGEGYLTRENAFYRMMLVAGLTSYQKLTDDKKYEPIVRQQVDSLVAELDARPSGLLEDYPGECYPADVMAAVYAIRRADEILGTDHSAFVGRMRRAFVGVQETSLGLPAFWADAVSGQPLEPTRGSANSYVGLMAPDLWPEDARRWYGLHAAHFWQEDGVLAGFREYPRGTVEWEYADMDAGPVAWGYGFAATAFGVGAAMRNGQLDHGVRLVAEMLPGSWPLPNGTLLLPRLLSDGVDAPMLGEACVFYNLTRTPAAGVERIEWGGTWPGMVYLLLLGYGVPGLLGVVLGVWALVRSSREVLVRVPGFQAGVWCVLMVLAVGLMTVDLRLGMVGLLAGQFVPRGGRCLVEQGELAFWGGAGPGAEFG